MRDKIIDGISVAALLLIAGGFYLAWEPLGLIVPGLIVLALAVFGRVKDGGQ